MAIDVTNVFNSLTIDILIRLSYGVLETQTVILTVSSVCVDLGVLWVRKSDGGNQLEADQITQSR